MSILLKEVTTPKDFREFIHLPEKIHREHANWLPTLLSDDKKFFDPKKNPSFRSCDYRMVLAYKDNAPVGRIMGIINNKHNETFNLKNARFGFLECYNDKEASHALIGDIEEWGGKKGMTNIIGPFGFSDRDIQGLLVEGFEYEPVVDSAVNFEYLPELVTSEGYEKDIDCVITRYPLTNKLPDTFERIFQRVTSKKGFRFLEFTSRREMKAFIVPVLQMVNESFGGIYGFIPMDEVEMLDLAKRYLPILDPRFVKIVTLDDKSNKVVAFMVSMPNCYKGIRKSRGRLFPFGIFHILRAMKRAESVNTMLGAVHPDYQRQGFDVFLSMTTFKSAREAGIKNVDTHVVMEENSGMSGEFKRYGTQLIKRFRIYKKALN